MKREKPVFPARMVRCGGARSLPGCALPLCVPKLPRFGCRATMESNELLVVALDAARLAAAVHRRHVGRVRLEDWSNKGGADFVSFVDHEAEASIVQRIRASFPDHAIMAEEASSSVADANEWANAEYLWLVDPLDGTTNFLHGYPAYCASVAVAHG